MGADLLAELLVGNAEHRAVAHARHLDQHRFDLGGIDVDAARDDHVALAVAQEDVAVGILVADVAHRHEIAQRDFAPLGVVVVVGELREVRPAQIDLAHLALLHVAALLVDDAQGGALDDMADRAGLAERLRRIVPDHDAGLGGAVVFGDDRAPPFDHLALHRRRARRRPMRDPAQRGEVVASLHLGGQAQEAHEHGRHDMHVADPVPVDQPQHVLGVEARLQDHVEAEPGAAHAVGGGRGVVHRPVHQHDRRRIGGEPPVARHFLRRGGLQLGRRRLAAHALGSAGRTRRIDHAAARRLGRLGIGRAARHEAIPRLDALGRAALLGWQVVGRGDLLGRRHAQDLHARGNARRDLGQEVAMRHQHLGGAVAQDVARLLRREMPVDRHGIGAELTRRHVDLEGREIVAQHQGDAVVLAHAQRRQAARRPGGIGLDVGPASESIARRHARCHRFFPAFLAGPPAPFSIKAPWNSARVR